MIKSLHISGFKSWRDTTNLTFGPLTGFFGTNSSGKTALLQCLLMLKQTVESADRSRVLHTGDERTYVDLGTIHDIIHGHTLPNTLTIDLRWNPTKSLSIADPERGRGKPLFQTDDIDFRVQVEAEAEAVSVTEFAYSFEMAGKPYRFGMRQKAPQSKSKPAVYDLISDGYQVKRNQGRAWPLPAPVKSYGFPDQVNAYHQNAGFLSKFVLELEQLFQHVYYLGPLRQYPDRTYGWAGERPQDVGRRGEYAIQALLASRQLGATISRGQGNPKQTVEERVAEWLQELKLIAGFDLRRIAANRKEYEVKVRRDPGATEVNITDVGFGVSQILPVLVLCYYAPEGSTIILEHPEIHLHPSAQAGLADVFIDAIKRRHVQIILESHSEHFLRRLQRRIAEGELSSQDASLYFVKFGQGASHVERLDLDLFGNIRNWPADFFGDEIGDLVAAAEAERLSSRTVLVS